MEDKGTIKSKLTSCIIFAIFVYNIFTYLQGFYNFYINVGLVIGCIVIMKKTEEDWTRIKKEILFWLIMVSLISIALLFSSRESQILTVSKQNLHLLIAAILFQLIFHHFENIYTESIFDGLTLIIIISSLGTLIILLDDTNASRQLAGAASDDERALYYSQGVGGYGYIYFITFFNYALLSRFRKTKQTIKNLILILCFSINIVTIVRSSYSTAILFEVILIGLFVSNISKSKNASFIFLGVVFLMYFLKDYLIIFIQEISESYELSYVTKRMDQLLDAEKTDSYDSLRRAILYKQSFLEFLDKPLFGGDNYGNHSQFLDALGRFGACGLSYLAYHIHLIKNSIKSLKGINFLIFYFLFLLFASLDRIDAKEIIIGIYCIIPLIFYLYGQDNKNDIQITEKEMS